MKSKLTIQERINYILFASLIAALSTTHIFIFAKDNSIFRNGEVGQTYGLIALVVTLMTSVFTTVLSLMASSNKFNLEVFGKIARYMGLVAAPFLLVAVFMGLAYKWTEANPFRWQISDALIIFGTFTTILLSWNPINFKAGSVK